MVYVAPIPSEFTARREHYRQRVVRGTGRARKKKINYLGIDDFLLKNKSIININNPNDSLCAARAIVVAKAAADFPDKHPIRDRLTKQRKGVSDRPQLQAAYRLTREAQVPEETAVGPEELKKFQAVLPDHRLVCIYTNRENEAVAFSPHDPKKKTIVIVYVNQHYHGCNTLTGFYQSSYVCDYCLQPYDHQGQHRRKAVQNKMCKCCRKHDCPDFLRCHPQHLKATIPCGNCGRKFFGSSCFENHLKCDIAGKTNPQNCICFNVRHCKQCGKLNSGKESIEKHRCGFSCCPTCKEYADLETHRCFIESAGEVKRKREESNKRKRAAKRGVETSEDGEEPSDILEELIEDEDFTGEPEPKRTQKKPPLHVWFDLEARQENGTHEANLCVYQTDEGVERIIPWDNCVQEFIKDLKHLTEEDTRKIIVIAHNLQAYDGYFVIKELHRDNKSVTQIRTGAKILEISHYDIRFIDSLNFFTMPLKDFPKTFGLKLLKKDEAGNLITDEDGNYVEDPLAKGYFPHLFNRRENENYVGPLPPQEDYLPNTFSVEDKEKFEKWYKQEVDNHAVFNFQRDLVAYCQMDVTILRMGCQMFQTLFMAEANFNPFEHITIASACNRDLIENRLEKETIASEPAYGWNGKLGNQSREALEWLMWVDHCKRREVSIEEWEFHDQMKTPRNEHPAYETYVQHAGNGGECFIQYVNGTVDGFDKAANTVYEYQGCFWHGCERCYPNRTEAHTRLAGRQMYEVRENTRRKIAKLRSLGLQVVEMWGCEWAKEKENNAECRAFVEDLKFLDRLNPRDAFFGGRTNATKLYHKCNDHEHIEYVDFTSLYPTINKYGQYPIKHPEVYLHPQDQEIEHYYGIAKCRVRAPRGLYHPVLPVRIGDKLMFPLCVKC